MADATAHAGDMLSTMKDLLPLLLGKVACSAWVEQTLRRIMFNQVEVDEHDRDVLLFLWWPENNQTKEADIFRMTTHLFGGV